MSQLTKTLTSAKGKEAPNSDTEIQENGLHILVNEQMSKDLWKALLVFRFINALCVRTFFQPDEYFQALEPAWNMAFGAESGAWLTWEWKYQLRSSLHPALFAAAYILVDKPMELLGMFPQFRAMILGVLPNILQAVFAAVGDYYTWKLSEKMYGIGSRTSWFTLFMTMLSPWQWFCSTRTFSNSIETTLTIVGLYYWPWEMVVDSKSASERSSDSRGVFHSAESVKHLRYSLLSAAIACILRPTNGIIWFCALMPVIMGILPNPSSKTSSIPCDYLILVREAIFCGTVTLSISAISDRLYFREWTFPPYQWLHFNISQDLAVFYGRNDWHYYLSQGLPLLLTVYLPFTLMSIFKRYTPSTIRNENFTSSLRFTLTTIVYTNIAVLSFISHKEVRFIYPLLPLLHILTAPSATAFFTKTITTTTGDKNSTATSSQLRTTTTKPRQIITTTKTTHKYILTILLILSLAITIFTNLIHQNAVISVMPTIRGLYEVSELDLRGIPFSSPHANAYKTLYPDSSAPKNHNENPSRGISANPDNPPPPPRPFVGFLMPCHSTPWRSQLFHAGLEAWALSCEPPIHLEAGSGERENYRDEADRFYDDPRGFLEKELGILGNREGKKQWPPRYVVGFQGVEDALRRWVEGGEEDGLGVKNWEMNEVWRKMNSWFHDDSRRKGDVVIWEFVAVKTQLN